MYRIKPVKDIFQKFSFHKSTLSIIHINGKKSETGFPFIIKPATSDDSLGSFAEGKRPGIVIVDGITEDGCITSSSCSKRSSSIFVKEFKIND